MAITRVRRIQTNEAVLDQADFFQGNGYDRVISLTPAAVALKVFQANQFQPWTLVDGSNVTDALVVSGYVYWNEIPGAAGFYSIRWRPTTAGFWRLALTYPAGTQTVLLDYDVYTPPTSPGETGLRASFSTTP